MCHFPVGTEHGGALPHSAFEAINSLRVWDTWVTERAENSGMVPALGPLGGYCRLSAGWGRWDWGVVGMEAEMKPFFVAGHCAPKCLWEVVHLVRLGVRTELTELQYREFRPKPSSIRTPDITRTPSSRG